ncbi:hypothetical protein GCM10009030_07630 [Haloarcula pellucida]|uniref:Uncharacterized protein n=1 Tax=Haloarcula pellucida TaxID=1427151 RepID=A0A830GJE0_9EURY|nr:hypothetical protein GCM10009030_07630 [Halomicroarcula pellucida]
MLVNAAYTAAVTRWQTFCDGVGRLGVTREHGDGALVAVPAVGSVVDEERTICSTQFLYPSLTRYHIVVDYANWHNGSRIHICDVDSVSEVGEDL